MSPGRSTGRACSDVSKRCTPSPISVRRHGASGTSKVGVVLRSVRVSGPATARGPPVAPRWQRRDGQCDPALSSDAVPPASSSRPAQRNSVSLCVIDQLPPLLRFGSRPCEPMVSRTCAAGRPLTLNPGLAAQKVPSHRGGALPDESRGSTDVWQWCETLADAARWGSRRPRGATAGSWCGGRAQIRMRRYWAAGAAVCLRGGGFPPTGRFTNSGYCKGCPSADE